MDTQIKIKNLSFSYDSSKNILNNVSTEIKKGDFVAVVGKSGSGKSTFLRHLNGILKSDVGTVEVLNFKLNTKIKKLNELRKKVGIVFQFPEEQLFAETVLEDILFAPKNFNLSELEIQTNLKKIQKILNISDEMLTKNPLELSGGEKRRVALAGIFIYSPEILILDEPTIGLDSENKKNLLNLLENLSNEGVTIIIVSHDLDNIWEYAKKIIYMESGEIKFQGSHQSFFDFIKNNFQNKFDLVPDYIEFLIKNNLLKNETIINKKDFYKVIETGFLRWQNEKTNN